MTSDDALALIISEARPDGEGLLASVKNGEEPGAERMNRLISALAVVFRALGGRVEIDRKLAAALFALGSELPLTISSLASRGHVWRKGFMEDEVYELLMGVQSIFEDRMIGQEPSETVH
ncbi:MAG TPA: hypothetical protein VJQ56_05305 [Blastocatellia bacterium]|nr:hypothetical protein [Blastocatellia bacterium]